MGDYYRGPVSDPVDDREPVWCDCGHDVDASKVIEREDGFTACRDCAKAINAFEEIFGEEATI